MSETLTIEIKRDDVQTKVGLKLEEEINGQRVSNVQEGSLANVAGIEVDDFITEINGKSASKSTNVKKLMAKQKNLTFTLTRIAPENPRPATPSAELSWPTTWFRSSPDKQWHKLIATRIYALPKSEGKVPSFVEITKIEGSATSDVSKETFDKFPGQVNVYASGSRGEKLINKSRLVFKGPYAQSGDADEYARNIVQIDGKSAEKLSQNEIVKILENYEEDEIDLYVSVDESTNNFFIEEKNFKSLVYDKDGKISHVNDIELPLEVNDTIVSINGNKPAKIDVKKLNYSFLVGNKKRCTSTR